MTQKPNYLFNQKQMQVVAEATGQKTRAQPFGWFESKVPDDFIKDVRAIKSDVTGLVFQKHDTTITMSYTLNGEDEPVVKEYEFHVIDYKKHTFENSIVLTNKFFNLFMKKLGTRQENVVKPKIITTKTKIEDKIEAHHNHSDKIKNEIIEIKKKLDGAQKALENEKDEIIQVTLSTQIEQLNNLIKIREELLIEEEKKVNDILENQETSEKKLRDEAIVERDRFIKEMEMMTRETSYLQAVKTV